MTKLKDINLLDVGNTIQLAGAVYAGNGKVYLVMFPDERGQFDDTFGNYRFIPAGEERDDALPITTLDMDQEDWTTFLRQTDLLETEVLAKADDGGVTKAILRKSTRQIEQGVSWAVFRRDGYACRYCGRDDVPLTVDHLVLWEDGGPSLEENLVSACRKCNKTRGNKGYEVWLQHPYYKQVSAALTPPQLEANRSLVSTLPGIPRRLHIRSR